MTAPRRSRSSKASAPDFRGTRLVQLLRVSKRNGREGDRFQSPEQQRDANRRYVKSIGATIVATVDETDSVSGGSMQRAGLDEALAMCARGEADGLVVAKLDRWSRTLVGGLSAIAELEERGHLLLSAKEGVLVGPAPADSFDGLIRGILLLLAEWQRASLTENFDASRASAVARGIHVGPIPYGYTRDDARILVPNPAEAPFVVLMFERRAAGVSWRLIASELNEAGSRTATGKLWQPGTLHQLLANRVYLGEARSGEYVKPNAHEPLVSVKLFERAHTAVPRKGRSKKTFYLLTGVVRCASCGGRMKGGVIGANGYRRPHYLCRRDYSWGRCPAPQSIRAERLDEYVIDQFLASVTDIVADSEDASDEALTEAQCALDQAREVVSAYVTSESSMRLQSVDYDAWERGYNTRLAKLESAQSVLRELQATARGFELPDNLADDWPLCDDETRRQYLTAAFSAIIVGRKPRAEVSARVRLILPGDPSAPAFPADRCAPVAVDGCDGPSVGREPTSKAS